MKEISVSDKTLLITFEGKIIATIQLSAKTKRERRRHIELIEQAIEKSVYLYTTGDNLCASK